MTGVYRIIINGKSYIGSSLDVERRWKQHKRTLDKGTNENKKMQQEYDLCHNAEFELLETLYDVDAETLASRENYYIQKYNAEFNFIRAAKNGNKKKIYQFDLKGNYITEYSSVHIASVVTGISVSNLAHAAQENEKLTRTAGGYYWRYDKNILIKRDKRTRQIHVYDIEGRYYTSFDTMTECCFVLNLGNRNDAESRINRVIRGLASSFKGYRFSYDKVDCLDNSKLLSIKCFYPVIQIAPDRKTKLAVYETAAIAARKFNNSCSSGITYAIRNEKKCFGFYWTRLGTKWSELLESPQGIEAKTESETIDEIA